MYNSLLTEKYIGLPTAEKKERTETREIFY